MTACQQQQLGWPQTEIAKLEANHTQNLICKICNMWLQTKMFSPRTKPQLVSDLNIDIRRGHHERLQSGHFGVACAACSASGWD